MKTRFLFFLLLLPWLLPSVGMADEADSLLFRATHSGGKAQREAARAFFRCLQEEGVMEEPLILADDVPADTLQMYLGYWASEYCYARQHYAEGIAHARRALPLCDEARHATWRSDCLALLSLCHFRRSEYAEALQNAREALRLDRLADDPDRISSSLNTLAGICLAARQPKEGEAYILEAIRYSRAVGDSARIAVQLGMASEIYHALQRDSEALQCAEEAWRINTRQGLEDKAAVRLAQMAVAQSALGMHDAAEASLREAIPLLQQARNRQSESICHNELGVLLLRRGEAAAAVAHFREALAFFEAQGDLYNASKSHHGLGEALKHDHPAQAAEHMARYAALLDTLYRRGMESELNHYNARYKNEQLTALHRAERRQKWCILWGALVVVAGLLLTGAFLWHRHRRRRFLWQQRVEALLASSSASTAASTAEQVALCEADRRFLEQVNRVVEAWMGQREVDLKQLADEFHITRTQLNRKVKAATGMNTTAYISTLRVAKAKELLAGSPEKSVADVSFLCGIEDPSYFISLFKRATGMTPKQWRTRHSA